MDGCLHNRVWLYYYYYYFNRSSLSWKHHIDVGAGVVDRDYRGNVGVVLFNLSNTDYEIHQGDRIAQLIVERISTPALVEVEVRSNTTVSRPDSRIQIFSGGLLESKRIFSQFKDFWTVIYRKIQPVLVFCQLAVVVFTVCLNEKNVRSLNHLHCIVSKWSFWIL